jgi:NTE family protein
MDLAVEVEANTAAPTNSLRFAAAVTKCLSCLTENNHDRELDIRTLPSSGNSMTGPAPSARRPTSRPRSASECCALVLQGGGALGAYQAGAFEALAAAGISPEWIAGISIGAINAGIIAGNKPELRTPRLRQFWEGLSSDLLGIQTLPGDAGRTIFNDVSAWFATTMGISGFFSPRFIPPMLQPPDSPGALSFYDTAPLKRTLENLIDFDLLNKTGPRLSIGAVNIKSGNFVYFDSRDRRIGVEHILASGALPPGFPPVVIDGEAYWDGGLVSNTPLQYILDNDHVTRDLCIFQVDLFSARGAMPRTIMDVAEREKEIRYSSRTRLNTTTARDILRLRSAASRLAKRLPAKFQDDPDLKLLTAKPQDGAVSIFHLIHRPTTHDTQSKDFEFSRLSMVEHWEAGQGDVQKTLNHAAWRNRTRPREGVAIYDLCRLAT